MGTSVLNIRQINLHHSKAATSVLRRSFDVSHTQIALIQEPYLWNGSIKGLGTSGNLYCSVGNSIKRACIYVKKATNLVATPLLQFCTNDFVAIKLKYNIRGVEHKVVVCSAYFPYEKIDPIPIVLIETLQFCKVNDLRILVGIDSNSHNVIWGSSNTNPRGICVMNFIASHDLMILNRGSRPTFSNILREEVIDLTLCSPSLVRDISKWHVSCEDSLSDHMTIKFDLYADTGPPVFYRDPRTTVWSSYKAELSQRIQANNLIFESDFESLDELDDAVNKITHSLVTSYVLNCRLRKASGNSTTPWWSTNLANLKRDCNKKFNNRRNNYEAFRVAIGELMKVLVEPPNDILGGLYVLKLRQVSLQLIYIN